VTPSPSDVAVLTYTSGTTGPPKGAMNTHGNIAYGSRVYRDWLGVGPDDTILGIAPLYHVTGLTGHIGLALATGAPLVLAHRFDAVEAARLTEHHRATVTVAAITAFMAIANDERARGHDLTSLRRTYSGGAPVPPAVVADVEQRIGIRIRPVYGMTESTGATHLSPTDGPIPIDKSTGALSVGFAVPGAECRIADESGATVAHGEVGEVLIRGPQVVPGYWERPDETTNAIRDGELWTGDVGVMDEEGWLYLVDRSKDMIIASGFKVWPREVEDVLYEHEAVREAAVIGVPDEYRGETVWAFVSLKEGRSVESAALVAHCKTRLAAYKYPRVVHVLDDLPKTESGKILRRELRDRAAAEEAER
jgi:long-chain acyl-CoA synthetase